MGHSDISVTMNTYTHLGLEDAAVEMKRLEEVERARMEQERMDSPLSRDEDEGMAIYGNGAFRDGGAIFCFFSTAHIKILHL